MLPIRTNVPQNISLRVTEPTVLELADSDYEVRPFVIAKLFFRQGKRE